MALRVINFLFGAANGSAVSCPYVKQQFLQSGASTIKNMTQNIIDQLFPPFKGNVTTIINEVRAISCIVEVSEGEAALVKYWNNIQLTHSEWVALDRLSCTAPLPEEVLDAISDYFKYCD